MATVKQGKGKFWMVPSEVPMKKFLEEGLKEFRQALTDRGVYKKDHQNLERAFNGARDFVDYLLEGPWALEKGRRRPKSN
ncbi:MAG: hypothetical protein AABZ22_06445 [Nitrospirota bacterium]